MRRMVPAVSLVSLLLLLTPLPAFSQPIVSTFAGANGARGLAMDGSGRLYVSMRGVLANGNPGLPGIRRYSPPSNVPTIFADAADGLDDPVDMAFDDAGNLFVADFGNGRIHKISPGGVASVAATAASPGALTRDAAGNIYVGEYFTRKVLKIAPDGTVSTYVTQVYPENERLTMLYADTDGSLYAGDLLSTGKIWRIGPGGSPITLFADGLGQIMSMAPAAGGWVVTTWGSHTLRTLTPGGTHTLFAGATSTPGTTDGAPLAARFNLPAAILASQTVVGDLRYYIADYGNNRVRVIDFITPVQKTSWGRVKSLYRGGTTTR
jgi:hypothetical protein